MVGTFLSLKVIKNEKNFTFSKRQSRKYRNLLSLEVTATIGFKNWQGLAGPCTFYKAFCVSQSTDLGGEKNCVGIIHPVFIKSFMPYSFLSFSSLFVFFVLDLDKIRVSVSLMWYGVPQEVFATSENVHAVLQVYTISSFYFVLFTSMMTRCI